MVNPPITHTQHTIEASVIGPFAKRSLQPGLDGKVMGLTSRGAFLILPPHYLVFLTQESAHGPWTLNTQPVDFPELTSEQVFMTGVDSIYFPGISLQINTAHSRLWDSLPGVALLPDVVRQQRLQEAVAHVLVEKGDAGFSSLLEWLFNLRKDTDLPETIARLAPLLKLATEDIHRRNGESLVNHLSPFIGLGKGLTPSGDDCIAGMLLTYNRYPEIMPENLPIQAVSQQIINLGYQRTTTLAANLLESSASGLADERVLGVLDGICVGNQDIESASNALVAWGHSSGLDTLLGISLALLAVHS